MEMVMRHGSCGWEQHYNGFDKLYRLRRRRSFQ